MKLIVDTTSGSLFSTKHGPSFSIDVHYMDTVLMMKRKIEKSHGIPVSKQTLFLQGKVLQDDHYYLQSQFPHYTPRLLLSISSDDNPNQNNNDQVPQTEQSPSNPVLEFANNQGWPVIVKLFVDTTSDSSFSIDVGFWDTVLMMKQKIEKSQGIPVFKQTLFLKGKVLQDNHYYLQSQFPHYFSRLFLSISPDDNPNQNNNDQVPQTEQSPSNPVLEFANNQGWPVMSNNDQVLKIEEPPMTLKSKKEFFRIQDPTRRINSGSYSLDELLGPQDSPPVTVGNKRNRYQTEQSPKKWMVVFVSSPYCREIMRVRVKASDAVKNLRNELVQLTQDGYFLTHNKHVLNEDLSYEWNGVKDSDTIEISKIQDTPVTVWSSNQNHQTEKSSPSNSVKEMKTSPTDLTVYVHPFKECMMVFPVKVNANDNVEELRKELVNMEKKGVLYVPHERYQFVLRDETLTETKSFTWNLVADGDTIVIIRKSSLKSPFSLF